MVLPKEHQLKMVRVMTSLNEDKKDKEKVDIEKAVPLLRDGFFFLDLLCL